MKKSKKVRKVVLFFLNILLQIWLCFYKKNVFISVKSHLKSRYPDVAGRIITMALDSVDYSEEKALKILEIVMQDDKGTKEIKQEVKEAPTVENETAPLTAIQSEPVADTVDHEERYDHFCINTFLFCFFLQQCKWQKS